MVRVASSRVGVVLGFIVLVLGATAARADLRCGAEIDRRQVASGGQIVLTLRAVGNLNQQPRHVPPMIDGVEVVSGGSSQSFRVENGRTEHSVDITYYLVVRRRDEFTIPAITFSAGGQSCSTDPIAIAVSGKAAPSQPNQQRAATADSKAPSTSGPQAGQPGDPFFITLHVDRDEVWVGEQVLLVFRYHHRTSAWTQPSYTAPRTEGFWRVDLPPERNYRRNIDGQVYDVTEIRYALFATRSEELVIDPARLEIAGDPFQRFFGRRSRGPLRLATAPISVSVKNLPSPRPVGFSGIVADKLEFTATVDRDTVPRGEPVALSLTVKADGFLKSFGGIPLAEPAGLRLHDASENLREDVTGPRYRVEFKQEKAAVPMREGVIDWPPLDLVYFDTGRSQYLTVSATVPSLVVTPSDMPVVGDDPSGFRRSEIARLGNDLAFIHPRMGVISSHRWLWVGRGPWLLLVLLPWFLLAVYRWYLGRLAADRRDPLGVRRRRALAVARSTLADASRNRDAETLARAIRGFVADRAGRSAVGLTAENVEAWCTGAGEPASGRRLMEVLAACDGARYGGLGDVDVAALVAEVEQRLAALDKATAGRHGAVVGAVLATVLFLASNQSLAQAPVPAPGADPARLFAEGNQAYTDGDLETALERYREANARGADAAALHYNLANTHARRGELGRAIVGYLRAQRRSPRDADIARNLGWVRAHTRDLELTGTGLPPVIAQLDAAAHALSVHEWGLLLILLSWGTAVSVAWAWRQGFFSTRARRGLVGLIAASIVVTAVGTTRWYEVEIRDTAVIVAEEAEVRSGPATTFPVVFRVHDGLTLVVRGEREGWSRIGLGGDWVGWIPTGYLEPVRSSSKAPGR